MRRVEVTAEPLTIPWQEGCSACRSFADGPEPGLSVWVQAVASHFVRKHDVELVRGTVPEPIRQTGTIAPADVDELVEATARHGYELFRAAWTTMPGATPGRTWDQLTERTRRSRRDQARDTVEYVAAAVRAQIVAGIEALIEPDDDWPMRIAANNGLAAAAHVARGGRHDN